MGYNTDFDGEIKINPALPKDIANYIRDFSRVKHIKRDPEVVPSLNDGKGLSYCFNGNPGPDGCYYIGKDESLGTGEEELDGLSLWCDFTVSQDGSEIMWNQSSRTIKALEWISFLINHFIAPFGHVCNGTIECCGDNFDDKWEICVENNEVTRNEIIADVQICVEGDAVSLVDPYDSGYVVYDAEDGTFFENVLDILKFIKENNYNLVVEEEEEALLVEGLHIKEKIEINAILEGVEPSIMVDKFSFVEFFKWWKEGKAELI